MAPTDRNLASRASCGREAFDGDAHLRKPRRFGQKNLAANSAAESNYQHNQPGGNQPQAPAAERPRASGFEITGSGKALTIDGRPGH